MIELLISLILSTTIIQKECGDTNYYGHYFPENGTIVMCDEETKNASEATKEYMRMHEIGHKFMFESILPEEKEGYKQLFLVTREAWRQGANTYVSEYASFNYTEDFAETFAWIMRDAKYGNAVPKLSKEAQRRYDYVKGLIVKYAEQPLSLPTTGAN